MTDPAVGFWEFAMMRLLEGEGLRWARFAAGAFLKPETKTGSDPAAGGSFAAVVVVGRRNLLST
jgi:hypothetical protein